MALTNALASAISSGYYINNIGEKVTYKNIFIDLFNYAKLNGYGAAIRQISTRYNYIDRRYNEIKAKIDLLIKEMDESSFSDKYDIFLSFIQSNADSDSVNMPLFSSTNIVLSNRIVSLRGLYHELSVLAYKRELFITMMTNLAKNRDNMSTIISEIKNI